MTLGFPYYRITKQLEEFEDNCYNAYINNGIVRDNIRQLEFPILNLNADSITNIHSKAMLPEFLKRYSGGFLCCIESELVNVSMGKRELSKFINFNTNKMCNIILPNIAKIISNGYVVEIHNNYPKDNGKRKIIPWRELPKDILILRLFTVVRVKGEIFPLKFTIKEARENADSHSIRPYTFSIIEIESPFQHSLLQPASFGSGDSIPAAILLKKIKKSYGGGEYLTYINKYETIPDDYRFITNKPMQGLSGDDFPIVAQLHKELKSKGVDPSKIEIPDPKVFDAIIDRKDNLELHYNGVFYITGDDLEDLYCAVKLNEIKDPIKRYGLYYNDKHLCISGIISKLDNLFAEHERAIERYNTYIKGNKYWSTYAINKDTQFVRMLRYINDIEVLRENLNTYWNFDGWADHIHKRIEELEKGKTTAVLEKEKYKKSHSHTKVPSIDPFGFTAQKDYLRPVMASVYHNKGYKIASDAHKLLIYKQSYDPALEGKLLTTENYLKYFSKKNPDDGTQCFNKEGDYIFVQGKYPDYNSVLPHFSNMHKVKVDIDDLYKYVSSLLEYVCDNVPGRDDVTVPFFLPDCKPEGIIAFRANNLLACLRGAKLIGADTFMYNENSRAALFVKGNDTTDNLVLIMPTMYVSNKLSNGRVRIDIDFNLWYDAYDFHKADKPNEDFKILQLQIQIASAAIAIAKRRALDQKR